MAQIGTFKRTKTGISGRFRTLALNAELVLIPVDKRDAENAPDYRIHLGDVDGALRSARRLERAGNAPGKRRATISPCSLTIPALGNRSAPICSRPTTRERHSLCCGIARRAAMRRRDVMRARPANKIPLFDRQPVNPFVPIGVSRAVVRGVSQGWPQAGACASPLTEASATASSRPVGGGVRGWKAIITAIAVTVTGGSISAVCAASTQAQSAPIATVNPADPYAADIGEASRRFSIPESWIRAVMRVESRGQVKAVSPKGAIGLMQIMPDTWTGLRLRYRLGRNPCDPRDNILAGAAYLREMHDRYGAAGFLAAYNAGPGRYAEYLGTGRPLPAETLAYVAALAPLIGGDPVNRGVVIAAGATAWIRAPLFAVVADSTSSAYRPQSAGRLRTRPVTDLSGLEPPHDWHSRDMPRGASLFVARTSSGPPR